MLYLMSTTFRTIRVRSPICFLSSRSEDENEKERPWTTDVKICGLTASLLLGLYMRTLHPSVPGGDSGE